MDIAAELQKLQQLHEAGVLDDDEFASAKKKILEGAPASGAVAPSLEMQTRQWATALHLSVFLGYVIPFAGFVAPIVIWQIKKNDLPGIHGHGMNVANWVISLAIYSFVAFLLAFLLIGIPILFALGIIGVVFPTIGAIKANNGEVWRYPMAIPFFS